jgi:hypothetical protein
MPYCSGGSGFYILKDALQAWASDARESIEEKLVPQEVQDVSGEGFRRKASVRGKSGFLA